MTQINDKTIMLCMAVLKGAAEKKKLVTYGQLANVAGLELSDPDQRWHGLGYLFEVLNNFSRAEHGVMISSIIVNDKDHKPSKGFFVYAWTLGRWNPKEQTPEKFLESEQEKVFKCYGGK
jgi:hypothetical protein